MKKIEARIVADSKNEQGDRITSLVCTFPRFLLAELNTHRIFSRNSASSRAVPFPKMLEMVQNDPFIPIAWQEDHTGMQGTKYLDDKPASYLSPKWTDQLEGKQILESIWAGSGNSEGQIYVERPLGTALYHAIECAKELYENKATKQLANRLLEPFMWHTCIITATNFENFFKLRCPQYIHYKDGKKLFARSKKDLIRTMEGFSNIQNALKNLSEIKWLEMNQGQAEIHMMALAEAIWDVMNESTPKELKTREWHIPFGDNLDYNRLEKLSEGKRWKENLATKIAIATARCARISYINYEGKDDYEADIKLYDRLVASGNDGAFHASPFEHCARTMSKVEYEQDYIKLEGTKKEYGWCKNFKGFIQLRALIEK